MTAVHDFLRRLPEDAADDIVSELNAADVKAAAAVVEWTGLRCDRIGCNRGIRGLTETREQIHALTLRAEEKGWQCVHVGGAPMHLCPDHQDESLPTRRKL